MIPIVIDTNVLVAGLRSAAGASRLLLRSVFAGDFQPLFGNWRPRNNSPAFTQLTGLFQFALKTITALLRLAVLQHCLRLRALFSFLMQIGISWLRCNAAWQLLCCILAG